MALIIPYDKTLGYEQGALIRPDGKILYVGNNHESYAKKYCNGTEFELTGAVVGETNSLLKEYEILKTAKAIKEQPDYFSTSKLTREQLEKYRLWLETIDSSKYDECLDFLVLVLAYDKVETNIHDIITTTSAQPHVRFFNYYLMNWQIITQDRMVYSPEKKRFILNSDNQFFSSFEDREAEEEILEIKKTIKFEDRPLFFKN